MTSRPPILPLVLAALAAALVTATAVQGDERTPWVEYEGGNGPGVGLHVVLVSGDEEYRSEEALPQLGRILAERHGFRCTVLFAIDPDTGAIDPDVRTNIPGLEALETADLMVIATRFRDLPDEQMAWIDRYVRSGKPIVGIRTATHAFDPSDESSFGRYDWQHEGPEWPGGFGRAVLGETWIAHHGRHGIERTRGLVAPGARDHPIARGIEDGDVGGPTDVYRVRLPLPAGRMPIILGEVVDGMEPDDPAVTDERNDPMMPIAWTGSYDGDEGRRGRVFTSTIGSARDLLAEGTRRLLVQGAFWCLGLEDAIPAEGLDVDLVGHYDPTPFGFGGARRGIRPAALRWPLPEPSDASEVDLRDGDRVLVVGDALADRLARSGSLAAVIHAAHPDLDLVVRHVPWAGDGLTDQPREVNVPTTLDWIARVRPTVLVVCYGMAESLDDRFDPEVLARDLETFVTLARGRADTDPRVILVSPIDHEDLGEPWPTGDALDAHRERLRVVAEVLRDGARRVGDAYVDLLEVGAGEADPPLTINGIHPNPHGCGRLALAIGRSLGWIDASAGPDVDADDDDRAAAGELLSLLCDAHWYWRLRYQPTNTEYVWGRRREPFGAVNFPEEMAQLGRMTEARERLVLERPKPSVAAVRSVLLAEPAVDRWARTPSDLVLEADRWAPAPVEARGTETSLGDTDIRSPEAFLESFTLPDGYVVECFASEEDFAELRNPLAMAFDERGRLWILCAGTYPHLMPGERPACQLLILEDTDGDGRADERTIFADDLMIPTGFAIDGSSVIVGQAPDLLRLTDLDGDDVADERSVIATGFGMPDSHHTLSAFTWTPDGGVLMHEGVFTVSSVETPWGLLRTRDAAVWRLDPRTGRLTVMSHASFANPWGHVVDDFGQGVLADASGGENFRFAQVVSAFGRVHKPRRPGPFLVRGRPTAGCELIASRHFPQDVQGTFLVNQSIGFHGVRWNRMWREGSGWAAEAMPADLLASDDVNFRPVAIETGPDGALYVLDWCNPIIGHMQYSVRDPRRDTTHGRVWRIRHRDRPLLEPPDVAGADLGRLLELLRLPERNTRHHARRRLQRMPANGVLPPVREWLAALDPTDPLRDRLELEALWIQRAVGRVESTALDRVLGLPSPEARAAAVRAIRHGLVEGWLGSLEAAPLLERGAADEDMAVRLEAAVAAGFLEPPDAAPVLVEAASRPADEALDLMIEVALDHLDLDGQEGSAMLRHYRLRRLPAEELLAEPLDDAVARARLVRDDLPAGDRRAALGHLAGPDAGARAAWLLDAIEAARRAAVIDALASMLDGVGEAGLRSVADRLEQLAVADDPARAAAGVAGLLVARPDTDPLRIAGNDHARLAGALSLLPPGAASPAAIDALRAGVEDGAVDPSRAIPSIVRHAPDPEQLAVWLVALVEPVRSVPLSRWSAGHERAMAALGALHGLDPENWPSGSEDLDLGCVDPAAMARGRAIYHDEIVGCARCHGADGRGLEGFPRLDRSPWLLGDPARSASIVLHGLYGPLEMPGAPTMFSAMAPLGELLDDEQIAAVLTWARRSWGNFAAPVSATTVARLRAQGPPPGGVWETTDLLRRHPFGRDGLLGPLELADAGRPARRGGGMAVLIALAWFLVPAVALIGGLVLVFWWRSSR